MATLKTTKKSRSGLTPKKVVCRILLCFVTFLLVAVMGILGVCATMCYGPSETAKNKFVNSTNEMSAMKWLPRLLLGDEDVDAILAAASDEGTIDDLTDPSLVVIDDDGEKSDKEFYEKYPDDDGDGIILVEIKKKYYSGYLLMITDPSRVYVSVSSDSFPASQGLRIADAVKKSGAVAAINAGGFPDYGGSGDGGCPNSLVISRNKVMWDETVSNGEKVTTIGFTQDDVLFVGNITIKESKDMNLRDAVRWGPALIVNGEPAEFQEEANSVNPRTAIGQRADGTVLMLVIDGRQTSSLGATFADLADILIEFGAVNAGNLDGGSSTTMIFNGEELNNCAAVWGARRMPTYIMVSPKE